MEAAIWGPGIVNYNNLLNKLCFSLLEKIPSWKMKFKGQKQNIVNMLSLMDF